MSTLYITAIAYAVFQILAGFAAAKLSDLWFLLIGGISITVFSLLVILYNTSTGNNMGTFSYSGLIYVVIANIFITIYTLYLGRSFQQFSPSLVIPMVFGLAILLSTTTGYLIQGKLPNLYELIGILSICFGLGLIGYKS